LNLWSIRRFPPEGWFYFGPLALTLILLFLVNPEKELLDNEGTNLHNWRSLPVKLALLAWLVFLSYLSYGEKSYLFQVFYRILPGFSALRGWGRLSIALLPGLAFYWHTHWLISKFGYVNRIKVE
jgi:hypothetical protein